MTINRFTFIGFEWNCYNGVFFELFGAEFIHNNLSVDSALFGFSFSKKFLQISIFYKLFEWDRK